MEAKGISGGQVDMTWVPGCTGVLEDIVRERTRQVIQYGLNREVKDFPSPHNFWLRGTSTALHLMTASDIQGVFRLEYEEFEAAQGAPTWMHLVREEIAEAFQEVDNPQRLEEELIQVAALCVSWVENIRHRQSQPPQENHE